MLKKGESYKTSFLDKFIFGCEKCGELENVDLENDSHDVSSIDRKCSKCQSKMVILSWSSSSDKPINPSKKD